MTFLRTYLLSVLLAIAGSVSADGQDRQDTSAIVGGLCSSKPTQMNQALNALGSFTVESSDPLVIENNARWALWIISALTKKQLVCSPTGSGFVKGEDELRDAVTRELTKVDENVKLKAPFLHLPVRPTAEIIAATTEMILASVTNDAVSDKSLESLDKKPEQVNSRQLSYLLKQSNLPERQVKQLELVEAYQLLRSEDLTDYSAALAVLRENASRKSLTALIEIQSSLSPEASGSKVEMTSNAINAIETELQIGQFLSVLYSGLSYSSILFLAAIGLAIVFGLMGVINLAQGEFIMIGAYITFVIQELLASFAYGLMPFYLLISIPFVFVLTGGIGAAIEYSVIRHLYTRPLMTLLATWGVSIFLVNAVRVLFGTQNLEFYVPDYLVGGVTLFGDFLVTWNRLATIGFAVLVLLLTWILVNKTRFGVNVRAVTENRNMAGAIGIDTRKVDVLSFALGSGLAGLAGLALSTIYNVNPTMGTNFIVDAFMVVVLGGVGSIWGTLLAALLVGIVNVAIEPVYGAVAAKVIVMTLIIVVIQFRPEGLFSLKVRK